MRAIKIHKVPTEKAKTDSASDNAAIGLSICSPPNKHSRTRFPHILSQHGQRDYCTGLQHTTRFSGQAARHRVKDSMKHYKAPLG
jgi:hypothetical protein